MNSVSTRVSRKPEIVDLKNKNQHLNKIIKYHDVSTYLIQPLFGKTSSIHSRPEILPKVSVRRKRKKCSFFINIIIIFYYYYGQQKVNDTSQWGVYVKNADCFVDKNELSFFVHKGPPQNQLIFFYCCLKAYLGY